MPSAFPGAFGWGAESIGGRGGQVIEVTSLDNSGAGTLREALSASGPRIVVFRVAGTITLTSTLTISNPYVTIAGQTAPGSGITWIGNRLAFNSHNVIMRYMTWRGQSTKAAIQIRNTNNCHDLIFDHCTFSWMQDDCVDINYQDTTEVRPDIHRLTFQNCIWAESNDSDSTGFLMTGGNPTRRKHIHHVTVHNCLFHGVIYRTPALRGAVSEVLNNLIYNWNRNGPQFGYEIFTGDCRRNYLLAGPMTDTDDNRRGAIVHQPRESVEPTAIMSLYVEGNLIPTVASGDTALTDKDADNWPYVREQGDYTTNTDTQHQSLVPLSEQPQFPVPLKTAQTVYNDFIAALDADRDTGLDVGNNRRLNSDGSWTMRRDTVDDRLIQEVIDVAGITADGQATETIPTVDTGTLYTDADSNGMSDEWETTNKISDPNGVDASGYTNIELFLNSGPAPTASGAGTASTARQGKGIRGLVRGRRARRDEVMARWRKHVEEVEAKMREDAEERSREVDFDVYLYPRRDKNGEDAA